MNTDYGFSNNFLNKYDLGGYSTGQFNHTSGNYSKTENTDITIITDDGDRVTISSGISLESSYTSYSSLLSSESSSLRAEEYEFQGELRRNFSISIVGDLDSQEYEDIISALETIDSMMKSASSGSMDDLQAVAEKFVGLDSLSSLSSSIQVKESVSFAQVQSVVSGANDPETDKESKETKNAQKLDHALSRILNSGKKHGKAHGRVKQLMNEYLSGLLDSFSPKTEKNQNRLEAGELMKDMIMDRFDEKSQGSESIVDKTKIESDE